MLSGKKSNQGQGVQFAQSEKAGLTFNLELQQWTQHLRFVLLLQLVMDT